MKTQQISTICADPDLVSVIIPTYNRCQLVVEAIESVRSQSWPHVQIIVVDDGSDDDTQGVLGAMHDLLLLRQTHSGQAAARNLGLRHARGAYVCSLDSDDLWHPTFLERSVEALRALDVDFVFANWQREMKDATRVTSYFEEHLHWWKYPRSAQLADWRIMPPIPARATFLDACACPSSAILFKRETVQSGWTEGLDIADDWVLILDAVLSKPCRIAFTLDKLWLKRVPGDNIYDERDWFEVHRSLRVHDMKLMIERYATVLHPAEHAELCRRLTVCSAILAQVEWRAGERMSAASTALLAFKAAFGAFLSEPDEFFKRLLSITITTAMRRERTSLDARNIDGFAPRGDDAMRRPELDEIVS